MKDKALVRLSPQVEQFVKALAPEPRCRLTRALKALADNRGDLKVLEGRLQGYQRLRVAGFRVILREQYLKGRRVMDCVFAERRSVVYEVLATLLAEGLTQEPIHPPAAAPPGRPTGKTRDHGPKGEGLSDYPTIGLSDGGERRL